MENTDNRLTFCGELPKHVATPFFLLDTDVLRARVTYLRQKLPAGTGVCYAVKTNTFVLRDMIGSADRFEICSPGEAAICFASGVPEETMVISGVYKTPDFIASLVADHPRIGLYTVESMQQYTLLSRLAHEAGRPLAVLLRLTGGDQFGLNREEIDRILAKPEPLLPVRGLQYFSGTQKRSAKRLRRELENLDAYLTELREHGVMLPELEYGPGLPVAYFEGDEQDETALLCELSTLLDGLQNPVHITLEIGRSIAASCGTYFTRVVDKKCNKNERYAIVDGGIHHLTYYGQSLALRVPQHRWIPARDESAVAESWNICGSLCTVNDILVKQLPVQNLQVDDVIAFENTGAYCTTEAMALFLSRDLPAVVLRRGNDYVLARKPLAVSPINTSNEERI